MPVEPLDADVVATGGRFLRPPISTPTFATHYNRRFVSELDCRLRLLDEQMRLRRRIYGDDLVEESRPGHTPSPVRAQFQSEQHDAIREFVAGLSPPTASVVGTPEYPPPSQPRALTVEYVPDPNWEVPSLSPSTTAKSEPFSVPLTPADAPVVSGPRKSPRSQKRRFGDADDDARADKHTQCQAKASCLVPARPLRRSKRLRTS